MEPHNQATGNRVNEKLPFNKEKISGRSSLTKGRPFPTTSRGWGEREREQKETGQKTHYGRNSLV